MEDCGEELVPVPVPVIGHVVCCLADSFNANCCLVNNKLELSSIELNKWEQSRKDPEMILK